MFYVCGNCINFLGEGKGVPCSDQSVREKDLPCKVGRYLRNHFEPKELSESLKRILEIFNNITDVNELYWLLNITNKKITGIKEKLQSEGIEKLRVGQRVEVRLRKGIIEIGKITHLSEKTIRVQLEKTGERLSTWVKNINPIE